MKTRCLWAVVLGYVVLFVGLGRTEGGGELFWLSVICTLGVALIVWTAIAFVIGMLLILLYEGLRTLARLAGVKTVPTKPGASKWTAPVEEFTDPAFQKTTTPKQYAFLTDYIRKARREGLSDKRIKDHLKRQGWTAAETEEAFARCTGSLFPLSADPDRTPP
jgi:hypothetical protein